MQILINRFSVTILSAIILGLALPAHAQEKYPREVQVALTKAASNRIELENAIKWFSKPGDSVKLQALYFLLGNMDIHYSSNYFWADSGNNKIEYNELDYPDFSTAINEFNKIKSSKKKVHPVPVKQYDLNYITADFLIETVNKAFEIWVQPWAKQIPFDIFCEYILPYRVSIEPLQNWKEKYNGMYSFLIDSSFNDVPRQSLRYLIKDINTWFTCTSNFEERKEPLPRLGSLQILLRKKGFCEDVGDLAVFALRSQGIPATVEYVPFWATSSGGHAFNVAFNGDFKPIPFDVLFKSDSLYRLIREPAKVLRATFSKQKNALASLYPNAVTPPGFLTAKNYIDVTPEYWKTSNVTCKLPKEMNIKSNDSNIIYACVHNYNQWRPAWWGKREGDSVTFTDMCKGAVFLPMYYTNGRLKPAGDPVVSGYTNSMVLKADTANKQTVIIKEQDKYLAFRAGKKYQLFYWANGWKLVKEKQTPKELPIGYGGLSFDNVPRNALLLLIPEYSQGKERPFNYLDDGTRLWW